MLTLKRLLSKVISQSESWKKTNPLFQKFYLKCLTLTLTITLFLMDLRRLILSLFIRKMILLIKLIIDPLVFYLFYLKLLNAAYMIKFMNILILYYQKVQCGFQKGFSTQSSLIAMIEQRSKNMDKGKLCAALLTALSKAFGCIVHNFLIAKLETYGFSYEAVKVMYNYLTDMKHRTKVNDSFSDFIELLLGL